MESHRRLKGEALAEVYSGGCSGPALHRIPEELEENRKGATLHFKGGRESNDCHMGGRLKIRMPSNASSIPKGAEGH